MDWFAELWTAAKQAGPFASLFLLYVIWAVNEERKAERGKYEALVARFVELASDTSSTLKDWRDVLTKARDAG